MLSRFRSINTWTGINRTKKAALRQQDGNRHETWQKGRYYDTTENFAVQEDSCVYARTWLDNSA